MTRSGSPRSTAPHENGRDRLPGWATGILVIESIALLIAIVSPLTPSKTGSTWSPADLFSPDPTYLEKVGASFVVVNILILLLGLVAVVVSRLGESEQSKPPKEE